MFGLATKDHITFVEIGSQAGWWAYRCLRTLPWVNLWCIDPWIRDWEPSAIDTRYEFITGEEMYREWERNVAPFGCRAIPVRNTSDEVSKTWQSQIDFLFIDGDHSAAQLYRDLVNWVPRVRPGGIVVGHDIRQPKVRKAVNKFWPGKCKSANHKFKRLKLARQVVLNVEDKPSVEKLVLSDCFWRYV
jgi:hypothetical protein